MLTNLHHQNPLLPAQRAYEALTFTQKQRLGDILIRARKAQHITGATLLEVWFDHDLTDALDTSLCSYRLRTRPRWKVFPVTAHFLEIELNRAIELASINEEPSQVAIAGLCTNPLRQLTMLANTERQTIRPWLTQLRQCLPFGCRSQPLERWVGLGYVSNIRIAQQYTASSSDKRWSIDMMKLYLKTLQLKPAPTSLQALAYLATAKPPS